MRAETARGKGTIPGLDGVRAVAVLMVLAAHTGLEGLVPGGLGVTVFFVLSGFLITTLLLTEHQRKGSIDIVSFYRRRVVRLMPPLLIVIAVSGLLARLGWITGGFSGEGLLAVLFYVGNYFFIANDFHEIPAGIGVIWSLAVEEQFYLLYPPLLIVLLRGRRRTAIAVLAALCMAVLLWRGVLFAHGISDVYISMATDTRIDAILAGCLLALWRNPWLDAPRPTTPKLDLAIIFACLGVLLATLLWREPLFRNTLRYSLQSFAIAPLLWMSVARSDRPPFRWLNAQPLIYIGSISYAAYLVHQVFFLAIDKHWPQLPDAATALLTLALTFCSAAAIRHWVELPLQRLRRHGVPTDTRTPAAVVQVKS